MMVSSEGHADRALGIKRLSLCRVVAQFPKNFLRLRAKLLRRQPDLRHLAIVANGMADKRYGRTGRTGHSLEALVMCHLRIGHDVGIVVDGGVPDATCLEPF